MSPHRLAFALLASLLVACSSDSGATTDATTDATGGTAGSGGQGGSAAHAGSGQSGSSTSGSGGHAAGTAQGGNAGAAQAGSGQSGKSQGAGQAGSGQSGNGQSGQTSSGGQAGSNTAGQGQAGSGQAGDGQGGSGQAGDGQAGSGLAGAGPGGSGQAGDGQGGSGTAGSGQAGDGQGGMGGDSAGGSAGSLSGGSGGASAGGLAEVLTESLFNEMFPHREEPSCGGGIFTYAALLEASKAFPLFASEGTIDDRKRELAAFLANAGHETTGGWAAAPGGPQAWGLCFREELGCESGVCTGYCVPDAKYPCAPGKTYQGRGPLQLSYNYNYGQAGDALSLPLLATPELVATDGVISFKTALWFWMTAQSPKPSCHEVMVGQWQPAAADISAGRVPGFGLTVDIINGGVECDQPTPAQVSDRIAFYQRFTTELSVAPGDALACDQMQHY